ncbi:MAG: uracil-DNA glycosylase [Sphingomonas sp.]|uniref:uracil-DNA glycosylase family protein n=1 Tax=Sphingomonas sp. TaxID=28214 RepID=UPI0025FA32E7|nr:uracil-DNA glycosylase family protein [Sphingomonas sp.]MBX3564773.1 uracil-DNA glycosylase [Sphingomonas sp.]
MGAEHLHDWRQGLASALEWWRDAGVETLQEDEPRDWLARPAAAPATVAAPAAVTAAPEILPTTLEDFVAWRMGANAPESGWHAPLIAPSGPANAKMVVFSDMPCAEDRETLMSDATGRLFDRMLAAIGLTRDSVYLGSLAVARPLTGRVPPEQEARLVQLARHHVTLLKPERLLLFGQAAEKLIDGQADGSADVNLFGCTTRVVASYHPRFLLERPAAKSEAWKHLLLLTRGSQ